MFVALVMFALSTSFALRFDSLNEIEDAMRNERESVCIDFNFTDRNGNDCSMYELHEKDSNLSSLCAIAPLYSIKGRNAQTKCCACGGGKRKAGPAFVWPSGFIVVQGDVIIGEIHEKTDELEGSHHIQLMGAAARDRHWECPIPYEIGPGIDRGDLWAAMAIWERSTEWRFAERRNEEDYIEFVEDDGCASFLGKQGGKQKVVISSSSCLIHEIGHVIGLEHEHVRTDRDRFVRVNWDNINPEFVLDYFVWDTNEDINSYDLTSVMHYSLDDFSRGDSNTMELKVRDICGAEVGDWSRISDQDAVTANARFEMAGLDSCPVSSSRGVPNVSPMSPNSIDERSGTCVDLEDTQPLGCECTGEENSIGEGSHCSDWPSGSTFCYCSEVCRDARRSAVLDGAFYCTRCEDLVHHHTGVVPGDQTTPPRPPTTEDTFNEERPTPSSPPIIDHCRNMESWTDRDGDDCDVYEEFEDANANPITACDLASQYRNSDGLDANDACCMCGGGVLPGCECTGELNRFNEGSSCKDWPEGETFCYCTEECVDAERSGLIQGAFVCLTCDSYQQRDLTEVTPDEPTSTRSPEPIRSPQPPAVDTTSPPEVSLSGCSSLGVCDCSEENCGDGWGWDSNTETCEEGSSTSRNELRTGGCLK